MPVSDDPTPSTLQPPSVRNTSIVHSHLLVTTHSHNLLTAFGKQLIDFSKFLTGDANERQSTAEAILHGFQTAGFIYLKNHPIPAATLRQVFARSADFFALETDSKRKLAWTTPEANRGYSSPGREKVTQLQDETEVEKIRNSAPDLKESLEIGRDNDPEHPNQWPREQGKLEGFKPDMMDFFGRCQKLHAEVMRAIALGMSLDEDFFDQFVNLGDNTLRLLHYPSVKADVFAINPGQVRAGEHSVSRSRRVSFSFFIKRQTWITLG
jgi:isopenicillin N synthase-like dioxygenase